LFWWLAAPANIYCPFGAKGRFRDLLTVPVDSPTARFSYLNCWKRERTRT
jgi:hypothetical protein